MPNPPQRPLTLAQRYGDQLTDNLAELERKLKDSEIAPRFSHGDRVAAIHAYAATVSALAAIR